MGINSYTKTEKKTCQFCSELRFINSIERHEKSCRSNPVNLDSCPVCNNDKLKIRLTCSYGCRNTLLNQGDNHPNWKPESYRSTCFLHHEKRCVVCGEGNIVEVHHLDENPANNHPENLIPLCPTHHKYWHSRYRSLVESTVLDYIKGWKSKVTLRAGSAG